jgi:cell division protein FtsB
MEGQFLRKAWKPRRLGRITKRVFKTRRRTAIAIASVILLSYVLFNNRGVLARIRLEHERQQMIEKVKAAQEENQRLEAYLKALDSDRKTIEKVAREKYGMSRAGETVYKVKKN